VTQVRVLLPKRATRFQRDVAEALAAWVEKGGHSAAIDRDHLPGKQVGVDVVVAPHEYFEQFPLTTRALQHAVRSSVCVNTESPGDPTFELAVDACRIARIALDVRQAGVAALASRGVNASLVVPWATHQGSHDAERDIDVLFVGSLTTHRAAVLSERSQQSPDERIEIHLGADADLDALLRRTARLLHIPRTPEQAHEVPVHRMTAAARHGVPVEGVDERIHVAPTDVQEVERWLTTPPSTASASTWRFGGRHRPRRATLGPFQPARQVLGRAKSAVLAEVELQRRLDATECQLRFGATQHVDETCTPGWPVAHADVTVVITLFNYVSLVGETLASVARSTGVTLEVIVVDDHSTDGGERLVAEFMDSNPDLSICLVRKHANEGLAAARNSGFERARTDRVMVLDADNLVDPAGVRRLSEALDSEPDAPAAYGILADFDQGVGLRSCYRWDVERLCRANYIDAQAMIRVSAWRALGGYRGDDQNVFGWEDWDLWLRMAVAGMVPAFVPQVVGRYRVRPGSMIGITNLAADDALDAVQSRYPTLPWTSR
jgi:hypothetical protein